MNCFCPIISPKPAAPVNVANVTAENYSGVVVSNPVITHIIELEANLIITPSSAMRGEAVHAVMTVRNRSTLPLRDVRVKLLTPSGYLDVIRVYLDGMPLGTADLLNGVTIPGIGAGATCVLSFDARVGVSAPREIALLAEVSGYYNVPGGAQQQIVVRSNSAPLRIRGAALALHKTANREVVDTGNPLVRYTLTVTNFTNETLEDVVVTDVLPSELAYVAGSTSVNGRALIDANPASGIAVGSLAPGASVTVEFSAQLIA